MTDNSRILYRVVEHWSSCLSKLAVVESMIAGRNKSVVAADRNGWTQYSLLGLHSLDWVNSICGPYRVASLSIVGLQVRKFFCMPSRERFVDSELLRP